LRAIRENPPAKDIDGVKRRTRSGMGRCQGGFCQPFVAELIAKERGIELEEVTKNGKGSKLLTGVTK
jgi:glycerol-3-phosphate dehydrogenase